MACSNGRHEAQTGHFRVGFLPFALRQKQTLQRCLGFRRGSSGDGTGLSSLRTTDVVFVWTGIARKWLDRRVKVLFANWPEG